jgi:hypothetical protein
MKKDISMNELLEKSKEWFDSLSPLDQEIHRVEQRRSFIQGQTGREIGPDLLVQEIGRLREENAMLQSKLSSVLEEKTGDWILVQTEQIEEMQKSLKDAGWEILKLRFALGLNPFFYENLDN